MAQTLRLNRFLAACGLASRRKADLLIRSGRVTVNGLVVRELGSRVDPAKDRVEVDGTPLTLPTKHRYFIFHKPAGYLCSRGDPFGRPTIYDLLPPNLRDLKYVGRLDRDTEGLLLLTDDGGLIERFSHPRYRMKRTYHVQVEGCLSDTELAPLRRGLHYDGQHYRSAEVRLLKAWPQASEVRLVIREGKKREVRMMFRAIGRNIISLKRIRFGPIELGRLEPGSWRRLTPSEISVIQSKDPA